MLKQKAMNLKDISRPRLLLLIGAIIVLLLVVTFIQPVGYGYQDKKNYQILSQKSAEQQQRYSEYLRSIKPDPEASRKLFSQLIDEKDVKAGVEEALQIKQEINYSDIASEKVVVSQANDKQAVVDYFTKLAELTVNYNNKIDGSAQNLFISTRPDLDSMSAETTTYLGSLYKLPVPKDAVAFHQQQLSLYENFSSLVKTAQVYASQSNSEPWPEVYHNYAVANEHMAKAKSQFEKLDSSYQISQLPVNIALNDKINAADSRFALVKTANAQLGGTIIIKDIPRFIEEGIKQAISSAFGKFMSKYTEKLIVAIENNYRIANFLFYTDALVSGQYLNDYLNKYVPDSLDRQLVSRFIPQLSCAENKQQFGGILKAKAREYLGFDPSTIDPDSPDFYEKLAKLGEEQASPLGQYYRLGDLANEAYIRSYNAAVLEQTSPGVKAARSLVGKQIENSLNKITSTLQSALNTQLGLGTSSPDNIVAKITSSIVEQLFNKFLFSGVVTLKEQNTCIPLPQLKPVIAVDAGTPPIFPPEQTEN